MGITPGWGSGKPGSSPGIPKLIFYAMLDMLLINSNA